MVSWLVCVLVLVTSYFGSIDARVEKLKKLPDDLQRSFDISRRLTNLTEEPGSLVFWSVLQLHMSKFIKSKPNVPPEEIVIFRHMVKEFMKPVYERRKTKPRTRKEIRMLTSKQRKAYFKAVNAMKTDKMLSPNVYDFLADFHRGGDMIIRAHQGPAFPGWHRIYLWLYESFLRRYDPDVTVPYWASVLENEMDDATESVIFTNPFYGNEDLTTGPFQDWNTINPEREISRNMGNGRALYSYEDVDFIVGKTLNKEILVPTGAERSNIELLHGKPHNFIGGSMGQLDQASRDPIFFSHHAFVDYIWEEFRKHQRKVSVNPEEDYPVSNDTIKFHEPNSAMGFLLPETQSDAYIPNWVGYLNVFFDLVRYEHVPQCPKCGGSPYLYCNHRMKVPRCVSKSRESSETTLFFESEADLSKPDRACPKKPFMKEKDFARIPTGLHVEWVYIPVRVVNKRPPTYPDFKQYSLYNYSGNVPSSKKQFVQQGNQRGYAKCSKREESVGKIELVTYGVNHYGKTYSYIVVDNRLGLSISTGYVVVKKPSTGSPSEAIVAAFDSCGRVCQPFCIDGTDLTSASKCRGAIRVTPESPVQYASSYAAATLDSWYMPSPSGNPAIYQPNVPLTFYCGANDVWIWGED